MKGNTPIIIGILVVFAALAAFLLLSRKNTASAGTASDGNTYSILPGLSSGSNIMSFGTWYAKRKSENFSFDTTLVPASQSRL